jgi:phosphate uptake regulator
MEKKLTALGPKGRKSFSITLPIDWVRAAGLDRSRKADLEIVGNSVVVRPFAPEPEKAVLDASEAPGSYTRIVQILYKNGIDEIKLVNASPKTINTISGIIEQRCIGFEIVDQGRGYCVIKDIAKESAEDFQVLLRRAFLLVLQLSEEKDRETMDNLDKSLNKVANYCQRLLAKQGYSEFRKVTNYALLAGEIEHIGDEYIRAYRRKEKIARVCNDLFQRAYLLFYKFSLREYDCLQEAVQKAGAKSYYERTIIRRINTLLGIIYALKA